MKTARMLVGIDKGQMKVRIKDHEIYFKLLVKHNIKNVKLMTLNEVLIGWKPNLFLNFFVNRLDFYIKFSQVIVLKTLSMTKYKKCLLSALWHKSSLN